MGDGGAEWARRDANPGVGGECRGGVLEWWAHRGLRTAVTRDYSAASSPMAALRRTRLFQYGGPRAGALVGVSVGSPRPRR